jgi:hypothetical protein
MPAPRLFALLHRLIPVIVLSGKIPLRGCVFKESVKVCTPKSPPFPMILPLISRRFTYSRTVLVLSYRTWREVGRRPHDWASRSLQREFEEVIMVEVLIEEMSRSAEADRKITNEPWSLMHRGRNKNNEDHSSE